MPLSVPAVVICWQTFPSDQMYRNIHYLNLGRPRDTSRLSEGRWDLLVLKVSNSVSDISRLLQLTTLQLATFVQIQGEIRWH